MERLHIFGSSKTPEIDFDPADGVLLIKGRSIPEDSMAHYKPLMAALLQYSKEPFGRTRVELYLEYLNSSSSIRIFDILTKLEGIHESGRSKVSVNWCYDEDDLDMLETGEAYSEMINLPFTMQEVPESKT